MRGAVLRGYGEPLPIEERETPDPGPDQVLVEMKACGICRSDWHGWQGDYAWLEGGSVTLGTILGHEPAGRIIEAGDSVENFTEGDDVVMPFDIVCGTCYNCRDDNSPMWENIRHHDFDETVQPGAFCTHVLVPNADVNLVRMPTHTEHTEMAGLGCRFVTSYHAMADRADIEAGDWVAVHGTGGIGLAAVDVATALGANVIAVDLVDENLEMARDLGAVETVDESEVEDVHLPEEIHEITDGGAHVSVDGLGIRETLRNSVESVRPMGTHVQIGITSAAERGRVDIPIDAMFHSEVELITAKGLQPHRYDEISRLRAQAKLHLEKLVTREVALEDINDRLEAMASYETRGVEASTSF